MTTPLIDCKIITGYDQLTEEEVANLWDQGVNLDDWDYILILNPDQVQPVEEEYDVYDTETESFITSTRTMYYPGEYDIERMLTGCCDNKWYLVTFRGEDVAMGVAYHA